MTNFQKWRSYTDCLPAPDIFIDWGWYWAVGAALQRRIWLPSDHLFGNKYVVFVAEPGVGKDGPIDYANRLLTEHKQDDVKVDTSRMSQHERDMVEKLLALDKDNAAEHAHLAKKNGSVEKALLFPQAGDAVTYQALIMCMARSCRWVTFPKLKADGTVTRDLQSSSAMYFCITEISSLFRKHTEDLMAFFLSAYTCRDVYEYTTITRGRDRILRMCLNMLAATTPSFMQRTFDEGLFEEGFSSRTIFLYANKNRKPAGLREPLNAEQEQHKKDLSQHLRRLRVSDSGEDFYGEVHLDDSTKAWITKFAQDEFDGVRPRVSKSGKLKPYYARRLQHILKLAMALHFGESLEKHIPQARFEEALAILEEVEKTMHLALLVGEDNPSAKLARKIHEYLLLHGQQTFNELWLEFYKYIKGDKQGIDEALEFLRETNQVIEVKEPDKITQETTVYYKVKGNE